MKALIQIALPVCLLLICCSGNDSSPDYQEPVKTQIKYLALGDSYTIGESVCQTCRFPEQLQTALKSQFDADFSLTIIATTGWTTSDLKNAIAGTVSGNYDLVTLLIGVNNQYQHKPFSLYEQEFPVLLQKAILLAKGDPKNVIVLSIPDYAYTPYGQSTSDPGGISAQLDNYNEFAQNYTTTLGVNFVNITDITRQGLDNPSLVASDGLHPSELAYAEFTTRLLPIALDALNH